MSCAWDVELIPRLGPAVADYPPGSTFGPRDAESYEFLWILRGAATWACGNWTVALRPGTLLLVRPGMRDTINWDQHRPTRHAYVHFALTGDVPLPRGDTWPLVRGLGARNDPMGALCAYLLWLGTASPPNWLEAARDGVRLLVRTFVDEPMTAAAPSSGLPEAVVSMMRAVRRRWSEGVAQPLSLSELAAAGGVSTSTLCRAFRRQFDVGPVAALELLRLARAEPLLWMSNLSLHAIAVQCGFSDAYHFSRRFHAVYGIAPSGFRAIPPARAPASPVQAAGLAALEALAPASSFRAGS